MRNKTALREIERDLRAVVDGSGATRSDLERLPAQIISIISSSALERDCLAKSLRPAFSSAEFLCFANEDQWEEDARHRERQQTILFSVTLSHASGEELNVVLRNFIERAKTHRVIVIAQSEDINSWLHAVDSGAEGYIPPSVELDDLIEMIRVSSSRSVLIPRSSIKTLYDFARTQQLATKRCGLDQWFTERQLDVARALQKGSANKTIAYDLDLCESTVKVHVRNIMRKLGATNRTQASFRLNQIVEGKFVPQVEEGPRQS
jgi:DNA-binding NarL/FixJ family response regulator